jgi:hypothetical protein
MHYKKQLGAKKMNFTTNELRCEQNIIEQIVSCQPKQSINIIF